MIKRAKDHSHSKLGHTTQNNSHGGSEKAGPPSLQSKRNNLQWMASPFLQREKQNETPLFFYTKHTKAKLPCKAKIHCKDHHSRDTLMMLLPGSVCSPCKVVPHVIPSPYPPSETGCSTATETAAKSSSST